MFTLDIRFAGTDVRGLVWLRKLCSNRLGISCRFDDQELVFEVYLNFEFDFICLHPGMSTKVFDLYVISLNSSAFVFDCSGKMLIVNKYNYI